MYLGSLYSPKLRYQVHQATIFHGVPYSVAFLEDMPSTLIELLSNSDSYRLSLDANGYMTLIADENDVRDYYESWGALPDEETLTDVMIDFNCLDSYVLVSPKLTSKPTLSASPIPRLTLSDARGPICYWQHGWKYGTAPSLPNLRISCYVLPPGGTVDERLLIDNTLAHEAETDCLQLDTILWLDESAPLLDSQFTVRDLDVPLLRMTRAQYHSLKDWGTDIAQRKQIKRARLDASLHAPSSRITWRAVVYTPAEGHVDHVRANWRVLLVFDAKAFASGMIPTPLLQTQLPPSATDSVEPSAEQLKAICDMSWRSDTIPKMHVKVHLFAEMNETILGGLVRELESPYGQFGLAYEPNSHVLSRSAFLRRHLKNGMTMHTDNIPLAYDGYRLKSALEIGSEACSVCTANPTNAMLDSCGHTYCTTCCLELTRYGLICPACRVPFVEWTTFSSTTRKVRETPPFRRRMLELLKPTNGDVIVSPNSAVTEILKEWFPDVTVVTTFYIPFNPCPRTRRLIFAWTPSLALGDVDEVVQQAMTEGMVIEIVAEAESSDETIVLQWLHNFTPQYKGMSESTTYEII